MTTVQFNEITYETKLKNAGLADTIADASEEELSNILSNNFATKEDLNSLKIALKDDLKFLKMELQAFIVKSFTAAIGVIGGLQAFFHFLKV